MSDSYPTGCSGQRPRRTMRSTLYGLAFRLLCILAFPAGNHASLFPSHP